jgi:copper chaperone CopZ
MEKHTYSVKGMSCEHCVAKVEKALNEYTEIISCDVSLEKANFTILTKSSVTLDKLQAIFTDTKFDVEVLL